MRSAAPGMPLSGPRNREPVGWVPNPDMEKNDPENLLIQLLRRALWGSPEDSRRLAACDAAAWERLYGLAAQQGVLALLWEVLERLEAMPCMRSHGAAWAALASMRRLFGYLEAMGHLEKLSFDMSLARGLDYYTGVIYEVVLLDNPYGVGSIGAGGRYDKLVGMFSASGKQIPCVGISIGVERVFTILEKKAADEGTLRCAPCDVFVASAGKELAAQRMRIAGMLWRNGIKAEFGYQANPKLQKQLTYALESGVKWIVVVGEEEMKQGKVNLKNLQTREEVTIPVESVVDELKKQGVHQNTLWCVCCIRAIWDFVVAPSSGQRSIRF